MPAGLLCGIRPGRCDRATDEPPFPAALFFHTSSHIIANHHGVISLAATCCQRSSIFRMQLVAIRGFLPEIPSCSALSKPSGIGKEAYNPAQSFSP